jgi:hypothetical protein
MANELLHIYYGPPQSDWIDGIQTRLSESECSTLRARYKEQWQSCWGELAPALSTKIEVLSIVAHRFKETVKRLEEQVASLGEKELNRCIDEKLATRLPCDKDLPFKRSDFAFEVVADIDSFYYEFRSTYEIFVSFVKQFSSKILGRDVTREELTQVLKERGADIQWIDELRKARAEFFHNTAPWIALEIVSRSPPRCELAIFRRHADRLSTPEVYIPWRKLVEIYSGFQRSQELLISWIFEQISEFEQRGHADW